MMKLEYVSYWCKIVNIPSCIKILANECDRINCSVALCFLAIDRVTKITSVSAMIRDSLDMMVSIR